MPIRFLRLTFSVLDVDARRKFGLYAFGSIVIAIIESIGVYLFVPLTTLLVSDPDDAPPAMAARIGELFGADTDLSIAGVLGIMVLVAFTIKGVAALLLLRWGVRIALGEDARISARLFDRYLHAPYSFHLEHNSADLHRTLNESLLVVFRYTVPFVLAAAADSVALLGIAMVVVISDPVVAVMAVAYFLVIGVSFQRLIGGSQRVAARHTHEELSERYKDVQDALRASKEIAVLHRHEEFVRRFLHTKTELAAAQTKLIFFQMAPRYVLDLAFVFGAALIAGFMFATRDPAVALTGIGLFLGASFRLIPPLNRVLSAVTMSRTAEPSIVQVVDDLRALDTIREEDLQHDGTDSLGPVTVDLAGVRFAYESRDAKVLDEVRIRIEPGEDVGFVGSSGAGKTTLLDIMLGLLDPTDGDVLLGGVPIDEVRGAWQRSIGYVPQEVVMIDGSIRRNVGFGLADADIDDEAVWRALAQAQLADFVRELDAGLETSVGEAGVALSGGQRQRIGLARALYHQPKVLILDEATSALDGETERRIMDTIVQLRGSLTLISVAHRLSTLTHCDRIYYLREGRVEASGTFAELTDSVPEFAALVARSQVDAR